MQNKIVAYLIAEPFKGYTQTIIYEDAQGVERVAYSGRTRVTRYLGNGREEAKHYGQTRAQRSKQSGAMAEIAASVTETDEIGRA